MGRTTGNICVVRFLLTVRINTYNIILERGVAYAIDISRDDKEIEKTWI